MKRLIALVVGVLGMALPASALAVAEVEPNNGVWEADGPLVPGTPQTGTIDSNSDRDVYILYASGPGEATVKLTNTSDPGGHDAYLYFENEFGKTLNSSGYISDGTNYTISYTFPSAGTYYALVKSSSPTNLYQLDVTGPITGGSRPGPAEVVPNNNRDMNSAFGPLPGDHLYEGRIDAYSEYDWFYFYTAGPGVVDLATTSMDGTVYVGLYNEAGESLQSASVDYDTIGHITYTAPGAEALYFRVSGNVENRYRFDLTPGSQITTTAPPVTPPADPAQCAAATAAVDKAKAKVAKRKQQVKDANGHRAKQKAKKKLKKAKQKLKQARQDAATVC